MNKLTAGLNVDNENMSTVILWFCCIFIQNSSVL